MDTADLPAVPALRRLGLAHDVLEHGPVRSLAEAARARGVEPADVVKTLVVRRGDEDFLLVLVPGDRTIGATVADISDPEPGSAEAVGPGS